MSSAPERRSIGDLLSEHFSGAWGSDPELTVPNATVLRSTDIDDEGHVDLSKGAQRHLSLRELSSKRLQPGDILLEASGGGPGKPVGRPAWFSDEFLAGDYTASNFFRVLRADVKSVDAKFLLYALLRLVKRPEIGRFQQQTTGIINLKFSDYLRHKIWLPPLIEQQQRIAEILESLDSQIRAVELVAAKLITIERAILDDLLDDLPKESCVRLGDHLLVPPKNGYSPVAAPEATGEHTLGLACLTARGFVPRQLKHAPIGDVRLQRFRLRDGDVLISRSNTRDLVGLAGIFRDVGAPCYYPDLMMRLVPSATLSNTYLATVLNTQRIRRQITRVASGTSGSMVKITKSTVEALTLPVPSRSEQERIEASIRAATGAVESELNRLKKLRSLKDGLMDDLLTGRVRVPEEVAS